MSWLLLSVFASSIWALDQAELTDRVRKLTAKFETMQQDTSKRVPADKLAKAQGIIFLDRTKAGFIFAYQGGSGVAMVRDPRTKMWGPVSFMEASEASLGFQVGGQQSFLVILLMNAQVTQQLSESKIDFGGEARGTAGDSSGGAEGSVNNAAPQDVLVYDSRSGLYGGAAIKGGTMSPDDKANRIYYQRGITAKEILFDKKVQPTEPARELANKIAKYSVSKK